MKHYYDVCLGPKGVPIPNVSVTVWIAGTGQTQLATIYSDDGITTKANPTTSDALGNVDFYVADGRYDLQFSGPGITIRLETDIEISDITQAATSDSSAVFKNLNNIRFADQFASISAAIADLPAAGGCVYIPAGTYSDNITITKSVSLIGVDKANCTINPASTASPVITIDGTNVGSIDGIVIKNLTIPSPGSAASDAIKITGKQNVNEVCDHIVLEDLVIGSLYTINTLGTTGFSNGINITGRTIYSTINRVVCNGHKGDGLHIVDSGGSVGPVNDLRVTSSQFNYNYGYGIRIDGTGSVTPHTSISFDTVETSGNAQNTALSPSAGILINGVWNVNLYNHYWEANCPSSADANAAQLRITGSQAVPNMVSIYGATIVMTASAAKYGIYNDATRSAGTYDGLRFVGSGATSQIHVASTSTDSHVLIGSVVTLGKPDSVADAFGTTHVSAPAMNLYARRIINNAQFPISANSFDLVTGGGGSDYPISNLGVTAGPVTINTITSGVKGQYLWINSDSGVITLTHNSGGAGSFIMNDTANRVLQSHDAALFFHDGTNWQEVSLGTALLGKANTWSLNQSFNGIFPKYNGVTLTGNGIASQLATVDLTAQTAAIGTTNLLASTPVAGQYRVSWNAKVTTAAGTSSTLGALTITYTDPDGVAIAVTAPGIVSGGSIATTATTNNTSTVLNGVPIIMNVKSGTAITYAMAYASNAANAMNYNLHVKLELM